MKVAEEDLEVQEETVQSTLLGAHYPASNPIHRFWEATSKFKTVSNQQNSVLKKQTNNLGVSYIY